MGILISLMLLFAGVGILVLVHACVLSRTFNANPFFLDHVQEPATSRADIDSLPCFDIEGSPDGDCAVCLENFKGGEKCRVLPLCNHRFHKDCVDLWLLKTPVCPICRGECLAAPELRG